MQHAPRYPELDLLRTAAIVMMVVYHFAFDLRYFYGFPIDVLGGGWLVLQKTTAITFLLITGASAAISHDRMHRKHLSLTAQWAHISKRATIVLGAALLVTGATYVLEPSTFIRFGILHLIGTSALLLMLFAPLRERAIFAGILLILSADVIRSALPPSIFLLPIGSPPADFRSLDYFPLLPWFGTILIGFGLGHLLYVRWPRWRIIVPHLQPTTYNLLPRLTFPGRHSLLIYLLHQPLILLAMWMTLGGE